MMDCPRCGDHRLAWNDPTPYPITKVCNDCHGNYVDKAESYGGTPEQIADRLAGYLAEWDWKAKVEAEIRAKH